MNKRSSLIAVVFFTVTRPVFAISDSCTIPGPGDLPGLDLYPAALRNKDPEPMLRTAAIQDYLGAGRYCRKAYNFYENRAKCAESWKLGIGVGGGIFGFLGSMMAAASTGGAAPGIAAGLAGVASVTLGSAEKGPLGTSAYEARRISTQKSVEAAQKAFQSAKTAEEIYQISASMTVACPLPSQ